MDELIYMRDSPPAALDAYETLASDYDAFTAGYAYADWFTAIHTHTLNIGIPGRRALDLACGTGKSTQPLMDAGYKTLGCDLSPAMIDQARANNPVNAEAFFVADMTDLPQIDAVDFVLCLGDAINYLTDESAINTAFTNVARALSPGGVFAFDVNTLRTYRTVFTSTFVRRPAGKVFIWEGHCDGAISPGGTAQATVEAFTELERGWERRTSMHTQRHYPLADVKLALGCAGFNSVSAVGQQTGGLLGDFVNEYEHTKMVFLAQRG